MDLNSLNDRTNTHLDSLMPYRNKIHVVMAIVFVLLIGGNIYFGMKAANLSKQLAENSPAKIVNDLGKAALEFGGLSGISAENLPKNLEDAAGKVGNAIQDMKNTNESLKDIDQRAQDLENKSFFVQATSSKDKQTCLKITDPIKEKECEAAVGALLAK
ncbi:MAG: hypothetical protein WC806_02260 [Candidatus Gracilibacteria bacterium]|jgi:hypothetical protein